ncbi:uncharacterized protein TNCV_993831 [Trichonephila clavipes]|nr:uncharacterized protein TNCV_993831 [Trichonephila clavipes]
MRQGIWAIFLHKISTDENPQHGFCPSGPDTWCRYKKAQLENKVYHHKHKLPVAVVEAIRPIFRDLSDPELLKKCLHGNTQNPNESINNVIWSRVPKKTFVHLETLSFGTYDAIASFNKGNATKLDILKKLNIEPGYYATCCMERLDKERITRARYANLQKTKEYRVFRYPLTPLDYFLWGYVKSLVYADKPQTLDHLEDDIRRVIADIRPQMFEKGIENWTSKLDYIRASRGSPMPEIIFKM